MIQWIIKMCLFILLMILGFWLAPPPTHPTPWMDGNLQLGLAGDMHAARLLIRFF